MTVRGLFYQLVKEPSYSGKRECVICKTEHEYKNAVTIVAGKMREESKLPWNWIVDFSRAMRKPFYYDSITDAVQSTARMYRGDMWKHQKVHVQLWCEKATLSGLIVPITEHWQVPFTSTGGFSSKTIVHEAAEYIESIGRPTYIYTLGDHDPSGKAVEASFEKRLRRYTKTVEIHFKKLAVTPEQIEKYHLPTRPTKIQGNPHAKKNKKYWEGHDSVEVDALDPDELEMIIQDAIMPHLDQFLVADVQNEEARVRWALNVYKELVATYAESEDASTFVQEWKEKWGEWYGADE